MSLTLTNKLVERLLADERIPVAEVRATRDSYAEHSLHIESIEYGLKLYDRVLQREWDDELSCLVYFATGAE